MKCPNPQCKSEDIEVITTIASYMDRDDLVKRRRNCKACGYRWNTYEELEVIGKPPAIEQQGA